MFGLSDPAPIEFPEQKRESLLNFLQGDNDKETRLKVDSAFSKATLYNIEGVFVLDWENGLTEEYTCKNNIWVHIGTNNNLYKMKIEQIKKDNQKDAPFYQNMTKIEVVESLVRCIYGGTTEDFLTKNKVFLYDGIVIVEGLIEGKNKGYQQFCKYNKEGKFWTIEDLNNPKELAPLASEEHQHQKHLMEKEAQTKKEESEMKAKAQFKELERKEERFEEIEAKYLEGIKDVGYHLLWLKDMKQKNPNWYKDHVRREHMELNFGVSRVKKEHKGDPDKFGKIGDVVSLPNDDSLTPKEIQDFVEHQEQKYLMEKEAEKQKDLYLKRLAAAECHPNQLTAQDLIQAAKDELISRVSGQYRCSPRTRKQESKLNAGWAGCIQYLEFLTEIQEKPNNVK